ncbi:aspartate kinase [Pseudolactococcus paracarnosus]|uniref:Aspartokinase n=1 Tax=Pseudolactococcus paracarnosus TaxID=2749962 RepID=A0ABT0AP44_9LACT|nr:aspartate kinase [Lactococcus paracarnosus]MCJ1978303.1 aspartate kinase [Lactococcus paracarnosus]MCJ1984446.1 aspartate kinase [Lactococcus paracarnosus]MCJ1998874.1 aspartate kinase [Lactococcus paracarnosus]
MKVIKFGGSSLASAQQLTKVLNIVKNDNSRRIVVVSAPGKRNTQDTKVTDALIAYYKAYKNGDDTSKNQDWIISRYQSICDELGIPGAVMANITKNIRELASLPITGNQFLYDTFLAAGENSNAKLIAEYFTENGINARYLHPKEAGIIVTPEPGNARLLQSSYAKLSDLSNLSETLVIPGFFGVTENDDICTFSRGGSDITGSIIAAGVHAELYENFTDVDGIFSAHPGIITDPKSITELTYKEMRELAYAGFSVLHDEALLPAYRADIPLVIKNTNNPDHPGTKIIAKRTLPGRPVVGIAADGNFTSLNISKYLMNREVGFGRKVLQILEDFNIRFEHMPTGIDDMSIIIRNRYLTPDIERFITEKITETLAPDTLYFEKDLSIIMIVGEEMNEHIGVTARAANALATAGINIEMLSQGSSEVSVMFIVKTNQEIAAIRALYAEFF